MIQVKIQHAVLTKPEHSLEQIFAEETETPQQYVLRGHSFMLPLGPGDVVEVNDAGYATRIVSLEPQFIFDVDLHLPMDYLAGPMPDNHPGKVAADALWEAWEKRRDVTITTMTTFNARLSTRSVAWVNKTVRNHRYVDDVDVIRTPRMTNGIKLPEAPHE